MGAKGASVHRGGRPRVQADPEVLKALAAVGCTMEEIATYCRCSVKTLERKWLPTIEQGRQLARISVRRKAYEMMAAGNTAVVIFLLKAMCGLAEPARRVKVGGDEEGVPVQHELDGEITTYEIPANGRDQPVGPPLMRSIVETPEIMN